MDIAEVNSTTLRSTRKAHMETQPRPPLGRKTIIEDPLEEGVAKEARERRECEIEEVTEESYRTQALKFI